MDEFERWLKEMIEVFGEVVSSCGGVFTAVRNGESMLNNHTNKSYKSCYSNKGFTSQGYYWTKIRKSNSMKFIWVVSFYSGHKNTHHKNNPDNYIRCIQ